MRISVIAVTVHRDFYHHESATCVCPSETAQQFILLPAEAHSPVIKITARVRPTPLLCF